MTVILNGRWGCQLQFERSHQRAISNKIGLRYLGFSGIFTGFTIITLEYKLKGQSPNVWKLTSVEKKYQYYFQIEAY